MSSYLLKDHAKEALKITVFCVAVTIFFNFFGCSENTILVGFYMAVMSSAATFSVELRHLHQCLLGGSVIAFSICLGGILGFYFPLCAKFLAIAYAGSGFYFPKKKYQTNVFVIGAITYLVFSVLPFNLEEGIRHFIECFFVMCVFLLFYLVFDFRKEKEKEVVITLNEKEVNKITASICVISLLCAWLTSYLLTLHHNFPRVFWLELTALVVVAGSQQNTIMTSIKRIFACTIAAVLTMLLFDYVMPENFWANFWLLVGLLYMIFFLNFSYLGKVVFIEMFVLSITYLLGQKTDMIALSRVLATTAGGLIVIVVTLIFRYLYNSSKHNKIYKTF